MLAGLTLYLFVAWVGWRLLDAWACDAGEGEVPSGNRLRRGDASGSAGHLGQYDIAHRDGSVTR